MTEGDTCSRTCIIENPLSTDYKILVPDAETTARLCGDAIDECLVALDGERHWQSADDFPPDVSGMFVVSM